MIYNPDLQSSTQRSFSEVLGRIGARYKNLVVLESNLSDTSAVQSFAKNFPDRFFHFGNALETMFGASAGFTVRGKMPLVCAYANLVAGGVWDLLRNYLCYPNLNIKVAGMRSGMLNSDEGATNQALEDVALMRSIPNMKVFCPADATETRKMVDVMFSDYGPSYIRLAAAPLPDLYDDAHVFQIGKGHIYKPGNDVCIFAYGVALHMALDAALMLERQEISVMVVNMSSIAPLDKDLVVECAKSVNHLVTVEDHSINGGLGTAVAEVLAERYPAKLLAMGIDGFGESGKVDDLFRKYGLTSASIADKIVQYFGLSES